MNKWVEKARRGFLRMIVLRMLLNWDEESKFIQLTGMDIREQISAKTKGKWVPSPGSIYPVLSEMEQDNIIMEIKIGDNKSKYYQLTQFGYQLYLTIIRSSPAFQENQQTAISYFSSEEFKERVQFRYTGLPVSRLKIEFERLKTTLEIIEELLKDKSS